MWALSCLLVAIAPLAAHGLSSCKVCAYASLDSTNSAFSNIMSGFGSLDASCKNPSSATEMSCSGKCMLLDYSFSISIPGGGDVSMTAVSRSCAPSSSANGCTDLTESSLSSMSGGNFLTAFQSFGVDGLNGKVCYCDSDNCNTSPSDISSGNGGGNGASAVEITVTSVLAVVSAGLMLMKM